MAPAPPRPTLQDVAARAGVSTATVSRALNLPARVAETTRDRIARAVAELGYAPDFGARALAGGRTDTIGAIVPTMESAIFAEGLQAVQDALAAAGFTLLVAATAYDLRVEAARIRTLAARGADGLLLVGHDREPGALTFLAARAVPALVVWAWEDGAALPQVGFDNRAAMRALARAVMARGHRRLAIISAPVARNDRARGRLDGVRDAMAETGLDPAALPLIETPYGIDAGARAFAALMATRPRPTAILCGNDVLAVGALLAAREAGLAVPGDVSVTGFDDIALARVAVPPLATVRVPHREMGLAAAGALMALIRGEAGASLELPTELMLRASLGPPPNLGTSAFRAIRSSVWPRRGR